MADRRSLQDMLTKLLGSPNVYYQPPESVKMKYTAIKYSRSRINNIHADDSVYRQMFFYEIIVIHKDPDSEVTTKVSKLPGCRFDRSYVADNLYHDVFTLYY